MSNYITRAIRFIHQFASYIEGCQSVEDFAWATSAFNDDYHRKILFNHGLTRVAFITSDYVIKFDYNPEKIAIWGGCEHECKFYDYAVRSGYGYLFAEITPYEYHKQKFYIMPRVRGIGRKDYDADEYMTEQECDWCWKAGLRDLHNGNYGWNNDRIIIFDYGANPYARE